MSSAVPFEQLFRGGRPILPGRIVPRPWVAARARLHLTRVAAAALVVVLIVAGAFVLSDDASSVRGSIDSRIAQDVAAIAQLSQRLEDQRAADLAAVEELRQELAASAAQTATARALLARLSAPPPSTGGELVSYARGAILKVQAFNVGQGTGFAIGSDATATGTFVLTATHVLGSTRTVSVVIDDGSTLTGTVVATSRSDASVIWLPGRVLPWLYLRRPSPGESVLLRDRLGRTEEGTLARVSSDRLDISVPDRGDTYWPGFSGSPIIGQRDGQVIGVVSGDSAGVIWAVPTTALCDVLPWPRIGCP